MRTSRLLEDEKKSGNLLRMLYTTSAIHPRSARDTRPRIQNEAILVLIQDIESSAKAVVL